jgi:Sugar-transfer associated ATP-grasp
VTRTTPLAWRHDIARAGAVPISAGRRGLRIARRLDGAARAHHAPLPRVALRAWRMTRRGWHMGDLALLGLLDPDEGPARERWAVRRGEFERLQELLNPPGDVPLVQDKRLFEQTCRERDLPTPAVLAVLSRGGDRETTVRRWWRSLVDNCPVDLVIKPVSGQRGIGVRILRRVPGGVDDLRGTTLTWEALARELEAGPDVSYLIQPRVRCHPRLRELSGRDALQTLRIVTLLDERGRAEVLYALLRIAVGDALMDGFRAPDSGSTGNLIARVEADGTIATPVTVAPSGFGLVRVERHPVTGRELTGGGVPEWEAARELALRTAEAFAPLRTVGWDVAPVPGGAVLIEGNAWWGASADPDGGLLAVKDALEAAAAPAVAVRP